MTHKQRTLRDFRAWVGSINSFPERQKRPKRKPRNRHEELQRDLEARMLRTRRIYTPGRGTKFKTQAKPLQKMIVDPMTGQWWDFYKYQEREQRTADRLKARQKAKADSAKAVA
jgi:hypothetical protein